jgi:hypothetical protein
VIANKIEGARQRERLRSERGLRKRDTERETERRHRGKDKRETEGEIQKERQAEMEGSCPMYKLYIHTSSDGGHCLAATF